MIIAPALALVRILTERRSASRQQPAAADTEDDRDPRHGEEDGAS
jgi:hypothetical protein